MYRFKNKKLVNLKSLFFFAPAKVEKRHHIEKFSRYKNKQNVVFRKNNQAFSWQKGRFILILHRKTKKDNELRQHLLRLLLLLLL